VLGVVDVDLLEDRLVELLADLGLGVQVGGVPVGGECERLGEVGFGLVELDGDRLQAAFGFFDLPGDALLFRLEELKRHRFGVVRLEELLAFVLEGADAPLLNEAFLLRKVPLVGELLLQQSPKLLDEISARADGAVVLFDEPLHVLDEYRLLGAVGASLLAADADEVRVHGAVAVLVVGHDEAVSAGAAPHRALEVVVVLADLLTGVALLGEQLLDSRPGPHRHQRLVLAGVLLAAIADDALVVGILEQDVEVREHQGLRRGLGARGAVEAPLGGFGEKVAQVPLAGGVLLECPFHDRTADRVDFDGADLPPAVHLADIEVSGGSLADGATGLGLLDAALDHFVGEVAAVELGDRTHDPVQQHSRGGVVDVLGARHQGHPGVLERQVDLDVVDSVPGQPVDLVNDYVGGRVLRHVGQHVLQLWPVGTAGALTAVSKFMGDDRSEVLCLAPAGITLSRDRVPLGLAARLGLFGGGDPQVDDRGDGALVRTHDRASMRRDARCG